MISTRHIRKDWPEWLDWYTQKTVSTMCGTRTKPEYAGIPGITTQPSVVLRSGKKTWGWCTPCVREFYLYLLPPIMDDTNTAPEIINLHKMALAAIREQYLNT
jgi:hypothetical protein